MGEEPNGNIENFKYTYSARERDEVSGIRRKYEEPVRSERDEKLEELRRLDRSVTKSGTRAALTVGIIGLALLGTGMSCTLAGPDRWFYPGIAIGVAGLLLMASANTVCTRIRERRRKKLAPRIVELADEIEKEL